MKTQAQAIEWAQAQVNKTLAYWGYSQCVAFVRHYVEYLGYQQPPSVPGAKDLWAAKWNPEQFSAHTTPKPGDIAIFGPIPANSFGHTSVVVAVGNGSITTIDQNFVNPRKGNVGSPIKKVTHTNLSRVLGYIRPKLAEPAPQPGKHPYQHLVGKTIKLQPKNGTWRFYAPGTNDVRGVMRDDGDLRYIVRGVDSAKPNRVLVNSRSLGDNCSVPLADAAGKEYTGEWKVV